MSEPTWRDTLPEDIKADPSLVDVPDVPTLAKNFLATKAMIGKKAYNLPADDWKPEQWQEWHKTIGVPEAPDKYAMPAAEVLEKAGLPSEVLKAAAGKFHEAGLTPRQAKALVDWYVGDAAKGLEMETTMRAEEKAKAEESLKKEFGDKYDAKLGLVKSFLSQYGSPELVTWANESGAGNNPAFVRALVKAGEALLEDSSRRGTNQPLSPDVAAAAAQLEIEQMKGDKEFMTKYWSGDKAARIRWDSLHSAAYPTKKTI